MRAVRVGLLITAAWGLSACAPKVPPALKIPREELTTRIKTICVLPTSAPFSLPDGATRLRAFTEALTTALAYGGFKVVAADKVVAVQKWIIESEGGFYDPLTGWRDDARYHFIRGRTMQELNAQLGCDAVLYPSIAVVTSYWHDGSAEWDGAKDFLGAGVGAYGYVGALSLWVSIRDLDDNEIYFSTGGIQVISTLKPDFWGGKFEDVGEDDVLTGSYRAESAARLSLERLLASQGQ